MEGLTITIISRKEISIEAHKKNDGYRLKHKYTRLAIFVPDELILNINRRLISKDVRLV